MKYVEIYIALQLGEGTGVEISRSVQRGLARCYLGNQLWSVELLCSVLPTWKFPLWQVRKLMRWMWKGLELWTALSINSGLDYFGFQNYSVALHAQIMSINPQTNLRFCSIWSTSELTYHWHCMHKVSHYSTAVDLLRISLLLSCFSTPFCIPRDCWGWGWGYGFIFFSHSSPFTKWIRSGCC